MAISRVRWRWVLPVCQVLLAVALTYTGKLEERTHLAQMQERAAAAVPPPGEIPFIPMADGWGYVPVSAQIVVAIDFPVGIAFSPLLLFDVKAPDSLFLCVGLAGVFPFWWWTGRWIDLRPMQIIKRRAARIAIASIGLLASAGLGAYTAFSYWGHSPLAHLGIMIWCLFGISLFVRMLIRKRTIPP